GSERRRRRRRRDRGRWVDGPRLISREVPAGGRGLVRVPLRNGDSLAGEDLAAFTPSVLESADVHVVGGGVVVARGVVVAVVAVVGGPVVAGAVVAVVVDGVAVVTV